MANKIFQWSKGVDIRIATDKDLSSAQEVILYYCKPSKAMGYYDATVEDTGTILGIIDVVDEHGPWSFQGWAKLSNSKELFTDIITVVMFEPIANQIPSL